MPAAPVRRPSLLRLRAPGHPGSRPDGVPINDQHDHRPAPASGLAAGMVVIAGIVVGGALGLGIGLLLGRMAFGIMVGSTAGLALGFYLLYYRYFKAP